ncbi:MAG TPA: hypothetical protein VK986_24535, partial [Tepidisphaeraceae bacterium]|nr:hypothetical protein [Tepidisphaeraceae bacterium]
MSDNPRQHPSLSEIGHLFLSGVRERQTQGAARPVRVPPGGKGPAAAAESAANSNDLTPEEMAHMSETSPAAEAAEQFESPARIPGVTAVISQHLNGRAAERVRDYARHLAANGERIGMIELDSGDFRLTCVERSIEPNAGDPDPAEAVEQFDARGVAESLEELSCDVDRWLVVLPNLRAPEARALLKEIDHWALLSTTDHDGVVSCYRTLKGLANVGSPRMTLALMEAGTEAVAAKVHRKLSTVCLQFLGIELTGEPAVRATAAVAEHVVMHVRPRPDKAQAAGAAQWEVMAAFVGRMKAAAAEAVLRADEAEVVGWGDGEVGSDDAVAPADVEHEEHERVMPVASVREVVAAVETVASAPSFGAAMPAAPAAPSFEMPRMTLSDRGETDEAVSEVIDFTGDLNDAGPIVSAVLGQAKGEMLECPVRAPMCPDARLAVTRERGLVLVAVARKGLRDLKLIAQAYRWLTENRGLIAMAMPQLAIDAHRHPRLRLLVDHADASAEALAPMLESGMV